MLEFPHHDWVEDRWAIRGRSLAHAGRASVPAARVEPHFDGL
jgi:hypothetical protein